MYQLLNILHFKIRGQPFPDIPVFSKNFDKPPSNVDATVSQTMIPKIAPVILPVTIPTPVMRGQNIAKEMGNTAEPIRIPMNRYTQPRLSYNITVYIH